MQEVINIILHRHTNTTPAITITFILNNIRVVGYWTRWEVFSLGINRYGPSPDNYSSARIK